ncbi:MAG: hypothetical protein AMXMBFR61_24730 [Fimbriimonadales bacterium]
MRRTAFMSLLAASILSLGLTSQARAHDAFWTGSFSSTGEGAAVFLEHEDAFPWAGWVHVTVTNESDVAWGDFHFKIFSTGQDVSNVDWVTDPPYEPQGRAFDYWVVDNAPPTGATLDLYFWSDPVLVGQTVTISVYNVNPDHVNFGVCFYPTPVPEPSTLAVFASGFAGLAALARRRVR